MSLGDDVNLDDDEDVLPPRKQRPDPPARGSKNQQQQETGAVPPVAPMENRERPAKRAPLARGTVALGGTAVGCTLLAVIGAAAGPLAVVATTAFGVVVVPMAWFSHKARSKGRGSSYGRGGRQRGGRQRGGRSWLPGGLGGGGRHGGGRLGRTPAGSGRTGAGSGRTGGTRSGGLPGLGGTRRRAAAGGAGAAAGRRRAAGSGVGATAGRRRAGTGANWPSIRRGTTGGKPGLRNPRAGVLRGRHGLGGGRGLRSTGRGQKAGRHGAAGTTGRTRPLRAFGRGVRGIGRGIGRGARGMNTSGFNIGRSAVRGVRKPTGRRAFTAAYQHYGKKKKPKSVTAFAGRVLAGGFAGMSAGTLRFLTNTTRKLIKKLSATKPITTQQPQQAQGTPQPQQPSKTAPKHPVPPPAFAPAPGPVPDRDGHTPAPAGSGGGTSPGGQAHMSSIFPPYNYAIDFHAACLKYQPLGPNGRPSIWPLLDALPAIKNSVYMFTNGYIGLVLNAENTLQGGLHPIMREAMAELWTGLTAASRAAENLEPAFYKAYADAIARANTRGRQAENV